MVSRTAARWIADGNTSLDDCEAFTSSFGCTGRPSRSRRPGWRCTSFMFMLVEVPEPVWNTSTGNWSSHWPVATSAAESWIARGDVLGQHAELPVDDARRALDRRQRADQRPLDPQPGHREVLHRPLRLRAPASRRRHPHLPHRVVLDAELVSGHDPNLRCCFDDRPRLHRAPPPRPGRHAVPAAHHRRRRARWRPPGAPSCRSSPRCSRSSPAPRSATSPTGCGPPTSRSCAGSSTTPRRRPTTASWPSTCSRTPTSRRAACCRCARTPAPRS